ncbi:DUF4153 domain-containing protein [Parasporobacterium paucivorans]|uniref:DUF4153 domain-containing protein n=1 Tax=Parasporobacterium paucivorans DSM 15970 TaxID=1122934 RepID=A0A1M6FRB3_9FIRM|nr:DUF4153 domain-containing protein [Parasporobacterium paucivorans]SHJ00258.1 protein of unknown function [Parasporobacterium paucivorans DSM 15970]
MNVINRLISRITGFYDVLGRFILTILFLIALAVCNIISINSETGDYSRLISTCITGALLGALAQVVSERFMEGTKGRLITMAAAIILTGAFYLFIIPPGTSVYGTWMIKTLVTGFALFMAFILVPSIKGSFTFNQTFMAAFKALFIAVFFASILFGGISLITAAINSLLFPVGSKSYMHSANIIYSLFAPLYFFSLIPYYPGKGMVEKREEETKKLVSCPKLLEILISYIIVPLTAVFTLILLAYIIINIGNEFWTNSLLEPMLVAYSIVVILVYILTGSLQNKSAVLFKRIFPKVLIPIVLLQTIASAVKVGDMGLPHTRYYVILYGAFAIIAGIFFSFLSVKKTGIVIIILIVLSLLSVIPPVDAFTVGRGYQLNLLKKTLVRNDMLVEGEIISNPGIPDKDKVLITLITDYVFSLGYEDGIDWLSGGVLSRDNFYKTFGFEQQYSPNGFNGGGYEGYSAFLSSDTVIDISGYDRLIPFTFEGDDKEVRNLTLTETEVEGKSYTLRLETDADSKRLVLYNGEMKEVISMNLQEIIDKMYEMGAAKKELTLEEATFTERNAEADLSLIIRTMNLDTSGGETVYLYVESMILFGVK